MASNEDQLFAKRARSFGAHAAAYAEHRPDYPGEGIRWALAGEVRPAARVLDLAAGTGKLTLGLLELGLTVTAVEPDPGMLAELVRLFPQVTGLQGTAEHIPLRTGSVAAVLVGQAFHWFDLPEALTEIARVLRPGGIVAALWNHEDQSVGWVAELVTLIGAPAGPSFPASEKPPAHPRFTPFERATFPHTQRCTPDSLAATIGTFSHALVMPAPQRAKLLDRIRRHLATHPETAPGPFDLPLVTTVLRARRLP